MCGVLNYILMNVLLILLLIFVILIYFCIIRQMLYAHLTHGRSFWRDNRDYNRGFWDLVRFYRLNDEYRIKPEELPNKRWYE